MRKSKGWPYEAICPECRNVMIAGPTTTTLVGYSSPEGCDHDDNCLTRIYKCKNNHSRKVSIRRVCSNCSWVGKDDCGCHSEKKLNHWPGEELPKRGVGPIKKENRKMGGKRRYVYRTVAGTKLTEEDTLYLFKFGANEA